MCSALNLVCFVAVSLLAMGALEHAAIRVATAWVGAAVGALLGACGGGGALGLAGVAGSALRSAGAALAMG